MPPLPDALQDEQSTSLFLTLAASLLRIPDAGYEVFHTVLSMGRMLLMSRFGVGAPATLEAATQALRELEARHPGEGILILDFLAKNPTERVVAQNDVSVQFVGRLTKADGGIHGMLFSRGDIWTVVTVGLAAYRNPGQEFFARLSVSCQDNVSRLADCCITFRPDLRMVVVRAVPAAGSEAPSASSSGSGAGAANR